MYVQPFNGPLSSASEWNGLEIDLDTYIASDLFETWSCSWVAVYTFKILTKSLMA